MNRSHGLSVADGVALLIYFVLRLVVMVVVVVAAVLLLLVILILMLLPSMCCWKPTVRSHVTGQIRRDGQVRLRVLER